MPVKFFYIDESYDQERFCLSAMCIRHSEWQMCFDMIRTHRQQLKRDLGILMRKEIHARDLVRGTGRLGEKTIGKWDRTRIFLGFLKLVASLPSVQLFNVSLQKKGTRRGLADVQMKAWDRLVNRIERTMRRMDEQELPRRASLSKAIMAEVNLPDRPGHLTPKQAGEITARLNIYKARAFLIADEGREQEITRAVRRMHIHNMIPSQFREWEPGVVARNITTERIIEDPVFKPSHRSYFLQIVDCIAFALLRQEVAPTPLVSKYGLDKMFDKTLGDVFFRPASPRDRQGVVRN